MQIILHSICTQLFRRLFAIARPEEKAAGLCFTEIFIFQTPVNYLRGLISKMQKIGIIKLPEEKVSH